MTTHINTEIGVNAFVRTRSLNLLIAKARKYIVKRLSEAAEKVIHCIWLKKADE